MRAIHAGLRVEVDECARLAPVLHAAAVLLAGEGQHAAADDVATLALAAATVAASVAGPAATPTAPRPGDSGWTTLVVWARRHGIPERTARRHAAAGKLPGATKRRGRWLVPDDGT